jgi:lipooligosaccharide transport system permease protein
VIRPAAAVLEYHLVGYRRVWRSSVFRSLTTPVLLFLGIGLSVGRYVDAGGVLDVPYRDFVAPGLLGFAGLEIATAEASLPVLTHFKWQPVYDGMAAAPLTVGDMIVGRLAYIALRVAVAAAAFVLVMRVFGAADSAWAVVTLPVVTLLAVAVGAPMFALAATVESSFVMVVIVRVAMVPMTLFSGVFFPLEQLPDVLEPVAYAFPLWHAVELCRAATLRIDPAWPVAVHLGILLVWLAGGVLLARARFSRRLTD